MKQHLGENSIYFKKAALEHEKIIFQRLEEPHIKEFWDNSQEHHDDILNLNHGRKQYYFYGTTQYWVDLIDDQPFSFILSDQILSSKKGLSDLHSKYLSKENHTAIDFGIGNTTFLGKGLAAPTLQALTEFYNHEVDQKADNFFIDSDVNNPRAFRVYEKTGFHMVGHYTVKGGAFEGQKACPIVKKSAEGLSI